MKSRVKKLFSNKKENNGYLIKRNIVISGIALLLSGILLGLANGLSGFGQWYSTNIYPIWVTTVGRFFGWFPFSVSEILLHALVLFALGSLIVTVVKMFISKEKIRALFNWLTSMVLIASMLLFLFVVNCGINYHRDSFADVIGLEVSEYTVEELIRVSRWLTERVNETGGLVSRDEEGVMVLTVNTAGVSRDAMRELANEFPVLAGYVPPPKPVMNSWLLSIQQVSGIFSPFTIEGNYNRHMVSYNIPFTATHELVHVRGFMPEDEANFIAFLACIGSEEVEFQYSGYLLGWIYARNALRRVDTESATELYHLLDEGVRSDLRANREFWARFDGPVAELQTRVNDAYLRANAQPEGVRSYGLMVDLMIAYFLEGNLNY
jgi:hypothetical protein